MHVFVLTGAGISAESGLGTFRDAAGEGIWSRFDPMKLATPEAFAADPALVQDFYNARRRNVIAATPNPAHFALARLSDALARSGRRLTLVTQNVDDLHERAGSPEVLHIHGELLKSRCLGCGTVHHCRSDLALGDWCDDCGGITGLRPHVVWFGEMPFHMEDVYFRLGAADRFVAIGTSGSVYPAAGLVSSARAIGMPTVEINLTPSDNAYMFGECRYGPASVEVPAFVDDLLG